MTTTGTPASRMERTGDQLDVPSDFAGLYQLRIAPMLNPLAVTEYTLRAVVEVRVPNSQGTVSVWTPLNRTWWGRGEAIPAGVLVRTGKTNGARVATLTLSETPHPNPLPQGERESSLLSPPRERIKVRGWDVGALSVPAWLPNGDLVAATWMGTVVRFDGDMKEKWRVKVGERPQPSNLKFQISNIKSPTSRLTTGFNTEATPLPRA